ncbi:Polyketide synthase [Penicillium ucsense]|uniref:Polyketide synthase n=1 Tax=Penicillium ucsense TaxID=2839758 RepID=A0A8J8W975_9EURO|nr:Polyketide synthase [Penicillium ucsense]KAF7735265.1 Polyketide synthase [Penicillium ucsense]
MPVDKNEPIAIIGMGCRFPGEAGSPSKLWDLLHKPRDVARDVPVSRFNLHCFYHPVGSHHGTTNVRQAYLLSENIKEFDARFFSIPPGCEFSVPTYAALSTAARNASSRLLYFFNWHGPSLTIDTACSSSLGAVNEAVQALRNGTSRVAVVCGINLCMLAFTFIPLSKLSMLSPISRCRMWDIDADGYARGEGVVCVVLKPLCDAIADGDPIEAVIREVGMNHDGRTKGLTMPSATAQAALIRDTYARAGLDPTKKTDRCQYFEAHGTGTKAGTFFPESDSEGELFVGSVKTVIGHTEGTAGLAGVMKACLALQNATIPPNLLFDKLKPDLEPFTAHLCVPTSSQPWPELLVNSFGFGGTNAHCILETFCPPSVTKPDCSTMTTKAADCCIPIVFSAAIDLSLVKLLQAMLEFLDRNPDVSIGDLAFALSEKRSSLQRRLTLHAITVAGHGVGAHFSLPIAQGTVRELDAFLASLPSYHRPSWTLADTIADCNVPVTEAAFSQPLCTTIQIILVDLLHAAGVKFCAVGFYAKLAAGPTGEKGSMMAVGTSLEDASELCQFDDLKDRICVAAHNSPASVTFSGDVDAINRAQGVLEEEGKLAQILKVDTAYHSAHMAKCCTFYSATLSNGRIQPCHPAKGAPRWYSSVRNGKAINSCDGLDCQYWIDNMVSPVLFCSTVEACMISEDRAISCDVEVGPHPALQGPVKETTISALGREIPYTGTLRRERSSLTAFSEMLGFLWSSFGQAAVSLGNFQRANFPKTSIEMLRGLPTYPWAHEKEYLVESRLIKTFHGHLTHFHDLLGVPTADGAAEEWRWRNILRINEIKWLSGHSLQGQVVFPATAHICLAMEAAIQLAQGRQVEAIHLFDLDIRKAIAIHDSTSTELLISLTRVTSAGSKSREITADFTAYSTISKDASNLAFNCCGCISVLLADDDNSLFRFSPRNPPGGQLTAVDGPFRALTNISRKSSFATGSVRCEKFEDSETPLLFHTGMLDSALHGLNAAHSAPGDGRLWTIVAPTFCRRITIISRLCGPSLADSVEIDCSITDPRDTHITGDMEVFSQGYGGKTSESEGLTFSPFAGATPDDDRYLFQESFLCLDKPDAEVILGDRQATAEESRKALDAERAAFFYLKTFHLTVSEQQRQTLPWYLQALLRNAERLFNTLSEGRHPFAPKSWANDTKEDILRMMDTYPLTDADFNLTRAVGEHLLLPWILNGETSILQHMTKDNYLEKYYRSAIGFQLLNFLIAGLTKQLCLKSPRMNFLEIGAGNGGATKAILEEIGHLYASYTCTDILSSFFGSAAEQFQAHAGKMKYKTLDITKDPLAQDYSPESFDVIVASNVLHATESLKSALEYTRKLLRPGGYLVMVEIIRNDVMRHGLVMGGLPGWWIGENDGRYGGPSITLNEWDTILRETGFNGIETNSPMRDPVGVPGSIIVARAQNNVVSVLSNPLSNMAAKESSLIVIGGSSLIASPWRDQMCLHLRARFGEVIKIDQLDDLPPLLEKYHVLSLTECDRNLFEDMKASCFENFKAVLGSSLSVLWVSKGRRSKSPYAGTTLGLFRTLFYEVPGTLLQTLDIEAEFEPEIVLMGGKGYVPKVRPHDAQNDRYNSSKRSITRDVNVQTTPLAFVFDDGSYIRVSCSFLSSIKTPAGYVFVSLGTDVETGQRRLCFSSHNESIVKMPKSWAIAMDEVELDGQLMSFVIADLTVQWALQMLPPTGTVLAYEPHPVAASLLSQQLSRLGRRAIFLKSSADVSRRKWTYIDPKNTKRSIAACLPRDITLYVDASGNDQMSSTDVEHKIATSLPSVCCKVKMSSLTASEASVFPHDAPKSVTDLLRRDEYVSVSIQPISQRDDLFCPDRTYWLAGLAGGPGRSLADFMIAHQALNIVLSSRRPVVDEAWVLSHKAKGAIVRYFEGVVTCFSSMKKIHDTIKESMPPIGGVANGAMVLRDIQGTINLDRLFSDRSQPLDWFIGFSSIAATVGNPGQSAYTAGNCFIKEHVDRRRQRLTKEHQERLTTRSGTIAMSENDLHKLFAEAILSGSPALGLSPEIITGLAPITVEQSKDAYWKTNMRLSLLIKDAGQGNAQGSERSEVIPLRKLLEGAKSLQDAVKVLSNSFKKKLQALKFLSDSDGLHDNTPLVDMGVDILVAMEVRSWFLKELAVNVPVMRILGGASIADLVEVVASLSEATVSSLVSPTEPTADHVENDHHLASPDGVNGIIGTNGVKHENGSDAENSGLNGIDEIKGARIAGAGTNGATNIVEKDSKYATKDTNSSIIIREEEVV